MTRRPTALRTGAIVLAVLAAAGIAVAVAIPGEEALARRAEAAIEAKWGVPVHIGRLHWQLLPVPMIEVTDVTTVQDDPIVVRNLTAWPLLTPLLRRQIAFERVLLDGARVPQRSVRDFKPSPPPNPDDAWFHAADLPLQHAEFRNVSWVSRNIALEFDGQADFDAGWRPREAAVWRTGVTPPARLDLHRIDGQNRWKADIAVADGSWNGTLVLQQPTPDRLRITGELEPRGVELQRLLETFKRKPVIAGRATGHTTLEAEGETVGELVRSLHTRTRFSVAPATILRFDLGKAIRSVGKDHAGSTPLQTLTGTLDTQADPDGVVMRYSDLYAKSGALSARGTVVLQNRQVNADVAVDLVDGVVGVPLKITGPTRDPSFSVPASAVAGAAVGTAVLPGVGTAIGARIGNAIGRIFGSGPDEPAAGQPTAREPSPRKAAPSGPPSTR